MSERAKPLSAKQKAVLCLMAGRAWNLCGKAMGFGDVTEFRHASVFDVTGQESLRDCDQLDYVPLLNYWRRMLGLDPVPDRTPKTALDRALGVLRDALQRWEFSEGYAATIMRARLGPLAWEGMPLLHMAQQLGAEGVRQVSYTVINRGREKHRAEQEAHGGRLREPHVSASTLPPGGLAEHFGAELVARPRRGHPRREGAAHSPVLL